MDQREQPNQGTDLSSGISDSIVLRLAMVVITLAAGTYLVQTVSSFVTFVFDVLIIVFVAWILSASAWRLSRIVARFMPQPGWASIPIAYLIILLPFLSLIGLLVPITLSQTLSLSQDLPNFTARISQLATGIAEFFDSLRDAGGTEASDPADPMASIGASLGSWVQSNALGIVGSTTTILIQTIFCISLSFYMTVERDQMLGLFFRVLPGRYHDRARLIMAHLDQTFFSYLKGISLVIAIYAIAITTIMLAAGLPFALPIGLTAGFIQVVPIIGEFAAIGIPIAIALLTGSVTTAIVVSVALISLSLFMNNVVLPRVYGRSVRMPGFYVLLAVVLGTRFAGPWGAMLGVPVAGFIYSLIFAWSDMGGQEDDSTPTSASGTPDQAQSSLPQRTPLRRRLPLGRNRSNRQR